MLERLGSGDGVVARTAEQEVAAQAAESDIVGKRLVRLVIRELVIVTDPREIEAERHEVHGLLQFALDIDHRVLNVSRRSNQLVECVAIRILRTRFAGQQAGNSVQRLAKRAIPGGRPDLGGETVTLADIAAAFGEFNRDLI
jgi:hypothetical protein